MKIIIDHLACEYQDQGSGPVIFLLHGWQNTHHSFDSLLPQITQAFRVITLDFPGFGGSEAPKEAWDVADYANFTKAFLQKLGAQPDIIVGHSFGGRVAIKGLAAQQLTTKKLVLIASGGVAKTATPRSTAYKALAKIGKYASLVPPFIFFRKALRRKLYQSTGSDYMSAGILKETFLKTIKEDLLADAAKITTPTLLVWGSIDTSTPLSDGKKFEAAIPNSKLKVFEGASHFVHQEKANEVTKLITDFAQNT